MWQAGAAQLAQLNPAFRRNLINCLPSYKPLHLMGTRSAAGIPNLALFSQHIHLGADPSLVGILFRPHTVDRDSLENFSKKKRESMR
ncbi:MAG: hypothetical protein O3A40_04910 [Bacteroidetes bacterium]|nr:hypothetical protein [Bacteroidota bacterium]